MHTWEEWSVSVRITISSSATALWTTAVTTAPLLLFHLDKFGSLAVCCLLREDPLRDGVGEGELQPLQEVVLCNVEAGLEEGQQVGEGGGEGKGVGREWEGEGRKGGKEGKGGRGREGGERERRNEGKRGRGMEGGKEGEREGEGGREVDGGKGEVL